MGGPGGAPEFRGNQGARKAGRGGAQGRGLLPAPRRPPSCSRGSVAAAAATATTAVGMEPPNAQAGTRGAPQLLVLALLLGAHPGMLRLRSGRNGGRPVGDCGKGRGKELSLTPRSQTWRPQEGGVWEEGDSPFQ